MPQVVLYPAIFHPGYRQRGPQLTGPGDPTYHQAIATPTDVHGVDFVPTQGQALEVWEFDLQTLPVDARITSVALEYRTFRWSWGDVKWRTAAFDSAGRLVYGFDENLGYWGAKYSYLSAFKTPARTTLADGSSFGEHPRLALIGQYQGWNPDDSYNITYWVRAIVNYDESSGPTVAVTVPASGSTDYALEEVAWDYANDTGRPQTHYQVVVYPSAGASPSSPDFIYNSGKVMSSTTRSIDPELPLPAGTYSLFVKVWSTNSIGQPLESTWAGRTFSIAAPPPAPDPPEDVVAFWNYWGDGAALVAVYREASPTVDWSSVEVERSIDGGAYERVFVGPPPTWEGGSFAFRDYYVPTQSVLTYRARYLDETGRSASAWVVSAAEETTTDTWWMIDPAEPTINYRPDVADIRKVAPRESIGVRHGPPASRVSTAQSGYLGTDFTLTIRCLNREQREGLAAVLESGRKFRLVDILGRSWMVKPSSGVEEVLLRLMPLPGEVTPLRDAHLFTVTLTEVL